MYNQPQVSNPVPSGRGTIRDVLPTDEEMKNRPEFNNQKRGGVDSDDGYEDDHFEQEAPKGARKDERDELVDRLTEMNE